MVRRFWLVLAMVLASAPLGACGLLTSGGDSRTVVADVEVETGDPDDIPTPARPPVAVEAEAQGLALPENPVDAVSGPEGGLATTDDQASSTEEIDDVAPPTVPVTAPPETAPPETLPPAPPPPPLVTTTTIDVQALPGECVALLRFFQEGMRLYDEVRTASGERIAALSASVLDAMERLDASAPGFLKPVLVDLLYGKELIPEFAKADPATARILFRDFMVVKRPASNALMGYFFGICPGVGADEPLPEGRDGWAPTAAELDQHLGV